MSDSDHGRQDDYRAIDREDMFRKSAGDLGTFGLKTVIAVSAGSTALLIGFRGPSEIVAKIGEFVLPFTAAAVIIALISIGTGYSSLQNWANAIGNRPESDGFARLAQRQSFAAIWLYYASVALLAVAVIVGLVVLYCT